MLLRVKVATAFVVMCLFGAFLETADCQEVVKAPIITSGGTGLERNGLLQLVNQVLSPGFARSYIASRLQRVNMMYPSDKNSNYRKSLTILTSRQPMLGNVPVIPEGTPTPKWIPGELIASQITKRQLRLIDESVFGPLKSATMFPSVMSAILVFNKPYDPERLAEVLKFNFGIEAEPNGVILEAKQ